MSYTQSYRAGIIQLLTNGHMANDKRSKYNTEKNTKKNLWKWVPFCHTLIIYYHCSNSITELIWYINIYIVVLSLSIGMKFRTMNEWRKRQYINVHDTDTNNAWQRKFNWTSIRFLLVSWTQVRNRLNSLPFVVFSEFVMHGSLVAG